MADHLRISVSVTPIEELADEQSNTVKVISGEVGTNLGGSGTSIDLANYSGSLTDQGYKDGAIGYRDAPHEVVGARLTTRSAGDFFFIRNTGFKYSSGTALGLATTDCVMLAIRLPAQSGSNGGWEKGDGTSQIHYIELAWLEPGQAIPIPVIAFNKTLTTYGANTGDFTALNDNSGADTESAFLYIRTFTNTGGAASDGNAVEMLCVT